jgi:hypothetical protein
MDLPYLIIDNQKLNNLQLTLTFTWAPLGKKHKTSSSILTVIEKSLLVELTKSCEQGSLYSNFKIEPAPANDFFSSNFRHGLRYIIGAEQI